MPFFEDFTDEFFFYVSGIVLFFTFLDWLLGEGRRKNMRETMGNYWLFLGEHGLRQVVHQSIVLVYRKFDWAMGADFFSGRRLVACAIFTAVCVALSILHKFHVYPLEIPNYAFKACPLGTICDRDLTTLIVAERMAIANIFKISPIILICTYLSMSLTRHFLQLMSTAIEIWRMIVLVIFDIMFALASMTPNIIILLIAQTTITGHFLVGCSQRSTDPQQYLSGQLLVESLLYTMLPTILYLAFILLSIVLKIARPVLQPVVMLFLIRFHESRAGLFTNLAIGLGLGAKFLQQAVKVWGA